MVALFSFVSLTLGVGAACATAYAPGRIVALERWGGGLLVVGLTLLGASLGSSAPVVY